MTIRRKTAACGAVGRLLPCLALALATLIGDQRAAAADPCPQGNLLRGRAARQWTGIRGQVVRATDGVAVTEGALWNASQAIVLADGASTVTWDLGAAYPLSLVWLQADNNDYYTLWGSTDGRQFRDLARVGAVDAMGLRARRVALDGQPVRYLRFGEGQGDRGYSLSEIEAYCHPPGMLPQARVEKASTTPEVRGLYHYWNNASSARWQLVLALLGLALLQWGFLLHRQGRAEAHRKLRDRLLALLGLLAGLTYINFGVFHFGNFTHDHEWTHYYVGAKFFPELAYERLYDCLAVADDEDGLRRRVELRKVTNLRTNDLEWSRPILADPVGRCKRHFSEERWQAFKHDVRFFRGRQSPQRWDDLQFDHGFNATPVWNIAGRLLAGSGPVTTTQLYVLAMLDPLYLLATVAVIWWAFGWRVLAVGLLVFATNFPSRFYWTGGSFLRWDWLFYLVAAICCLRKGRPLLAGLALGYATLLRVFPGFVFAGPLLAAGFQLYRHRRLDPRYTRFFLGAALAVAVLVPLSLPVSGGVRGYQLFVANTLKHKETPLTNLMGLRTVIAWRPTEVGRVLHDDKAVDPWARWKQARLAAYRQARPLYLALVLGFLVLLARAVRRCEPWLAAALGVTIIAVGVELTSYYYAFVLALALVHEAREAAGRHLLLLTAFTQFAAWAPLPRMATWLDEQYTLMSVASLAVFGAILWSFSFAPRESSEK
jgi:hypothetical protein